MVDWFKSEKRKNVETEIEEHRKSLLSQVVKVCNRRLEEYFLLEDESPIDELKANVAAFEKIKSLLGEIKDDQLAKEFVSRLNKFGKMISDKKTGSITDNVTITLDKDPLNLGDTDLMEQSRWIIYRMKTDSEFKDFDYFVEIIQEFGAKVYDFISKSGLDEKKTVTEIYQPVLDSLTKYKQEMLLYKKK